MSLYDLRQKRMPPSDDLVDRDGLRIFTPEAALARLPESFYHRFPVEAATALSNINDGSGLLRRLLDGGHSAVAGRLAGVLRNIGNKELADEILKTMHAAGYDVRESDPFKGDQEFGTTTSDATAMEKRLRALWEAMRQTVIDVFPEAPGPPDDPDAYLRHVSDLYQNDAYHSLSIEGYRVTADLIERVRSGEWDPDGRGETVGIAMRWRPVATGRLSNTCMTPWARCSLARVQDSWPGTGTGNGTGSCSNPAWLPA